MLRAVELINILVETVIYFFQDSLTYRKFKNSMYLKKLIIYNIYLL